MLAISAVQLPPQWMEKRDSVTFFAVDVISESGASWRVMRRYTDFLELKDQLGHVSSSFPAARFPKKHCFSCEGQKLEMRREALELWLRRATEHPRSSAEWLGPLRQFPGVRSEVRDHGIKRIGTRGQQRSDGGRHIVGSTGATRCSRRWVGTM